jgi:alanine racemase
MKDCATISLDEAAVKNNIEVIKSIIGNATRLSAVVKANAYGHSIEHLVPLLQKHGVDHFSVFDFEEAMMVKYSSIKPVQIMIMGWISEQNLSQAIHEDLEFYVFNIERLLKTIEISKKIEKKAKIHLEVETGMNRTGVTKDEADQCLQLMEKNKEHIEFVGLCSHLAGPESYANHKRVADQIRRFGRAIKFLEKKRFKAKVNHLANSAGTILYSAARYDLVRVGILIYGYWPSPETYIRYRQKYNLESDPLIPILSWESKIMDINEVKEGEFVGYGTSYFTNRNIKTAIIPTGYAGSFNRSLSNNGRVIVNGVRCGVVGLVNMNMIIVDITEVPDVKIGDKVVFIGSSKNIHIKASSFSQVNDKLNYEVLVNLPSNLERKILALE